MTTDAAPVRPRRSIASRIMPAGLKERLRPAAGLSWSARAVFLARWITGAALRLPPRSLRARRVLLVCHGNIIRSALAEALCRREAARLGAPIDAFSAGLHAIPGRAADPRALLAATALGTSLEGHAARPLTAELVESADLILVMDFGNDAELVARFPSTWRKVRLLGAFGGDGQVVIGDPYAEGGDAVRRTAAHVERAVRELVRRLAATPR